MSTNHRHHRRSPAPGRWRFTVLCREKSLVPHTHTHTHQHTRARAWWQQRLFTLNSDPPPPPTPHTRSSAPRTCWQLTTTALACYETAAGTSNRRRPIIRSPGRANTPAAILRGQTASNCCSSCSLSLSLYFPQVLLLFSCCTCAQMSLQVVVNINACVQTRAPVRIESFLFSVFQSKEFKVVCFFRNFSFSPRV